MAQTQAPVVALQQQYLGISTAMAMVSPQGTCLIGFINEICLLVHTVYYMNLDINNLQDGALRCSQVGLHKLPYVKQSCISTLLSRSLRYFWKLCHTCWILDKIAFKLILINSTESYIYTLAMLVRKLLLLLIWHGSE